MAKFQVVLQLLHPATNSALWKKLDDVCGDGSVPVEGNNFVEDESISKLCWLSSSLHWNLLNCLIETKFDHDEGIFVICFCLLMYECTYIEYNFILEVHFSFKGSK